MGVLRKGLRQSHKYQIVQAGTTSGRNGRTHTDPSFLASHRGVLGPGIARHTQGVL